MQQIRAPAERAGGEGQPKGEWGSRAAALGGQVRHAASLFESAAAVLPIDPRALEANRIVAWNKRDPRTAAFDMLRTKALREMASHGWRSLAVTSPTDGCGKTTVAINLALSIAQQGSPEVLLTDLDLRKPRLAACLGIEPKLDISAFLEGRGPLTSYLVSAGGARLWVLPNLGIRDNATELLTQSAADALFSGANVDATPRLRIYDLPPLLMTDDALAVLPRVDCALVVLGERVTRKSDVTDALRLLAGTNVLGVVLNMSRTEIVPYY